MNDILGKLSPVPQELVDILRCDSICRKEVSDNGDYHRSRHYDKRFI